jgi:vacuolar-type H+-ATPase subunit H
MGKNKTLRDQASELAGSLAPHVETAREKAAPYLADAREKAAPVLADVRDKAAPVLTEVRDRLNEEVIPVVTGAIAALDAATEEARAETLKRGKAVAAALKGEVPEPQKTHRIRNLLLVLGLGGVAFALAKRFGAGQPTTSWQSSYTPPPAPAPTEGAHRADTTQDTAASDPAEAAADATEVPHQTTTPDNPLTETNIDRP